MQAVKTKEEAIEVRGARVHNLKNISFSLAAQQIDCRHGRFRFGQIIARLRYDLRRRSTALCRIAFGIRAAVSRTNG